MKNEDKGVYIEMLGTLLVVVIFLSLGIWVFNSASDPENEQQKPIQHTPDYYRPGAFMAAEKFVKRQLKSPGSAKFPPTLQKKNYVSVKPDGVTYHVDSWVDSENTFGGLVRTYFSCTVKRYDRKNDFPEWELVNLEFNE